MYCAKALQLACRCLPQRIKPQTTGRAAVFRFFSLAFLQFRKPFFTSVLQYTRVPFCSRAKNLNFLGLLALLFFHFICNTKIEEIL